MCRKEATDNAILCANSAARQFNAGGREWGLVFLEAARTWVEIAKLLPVDGGEHKKSEDGE